MSTTTDERLKHRLDVWWLSVVGSCILFRHLSRAEVRWVFFREGDWRP